MSYPPGVPAGSLYATSVVQPVRQQQMMVQVAPVRHVAVLPASSMVMRPIVANPSIHTIAAPPRPQIVQTFAPSSTLIANSVTVGVQQQAVAQMSAKAEEAANAASQHPAITVFVSNITEKASDTLVRQILMKCGTVYAWKRVQGASGKLQAFGFCEYKEVESALRAIYLLHDFQLGDKKLLVKVDSKTQEVLDKWKETNGIKKLVDGSEPPPPNTEEARLGLDALMREYAHELSTGVVAAPDPTPSSNLVKIDEPIVRESHNVEENLNELDLEESEKDYISKEIRSFRATQKQREEEKKKEEEAKKKFEKDKQDDRQREKSKQREEKDDRDRSRKDARSRTPQRRRETARISRSPQARNSSIRRSRTPPRLSRTRTPPRRRSRSRSVHGSSSRTRRSRSRSPRRREDDDEDDEGYERRRMERKIREKEQAYQERLRAWEMRERRRKREYEKRDERESSMRKEMMREAKRLHEFLADYDDLKMDPKYYTGGAMNKRRREWDREKDGDARDIKKEKEEIDALKQKLVEENHPDPESAIAKAIKETESIWQPLLKPDTPPPSEAREPSPTKGRSSSSSSSSGSDSESEREDKSGSGSSDSDGESEDNKSPNAPRLVSANLVPVKEEPEQVAVTVASIKNEKRNFHETASQNGKDSPNGVIRMDYTEYTERAMPIKQEPSISVGSSQSAAKTEPVMQLPGSNQRKKLKVSDVFNQDDDEEEVPKKRKLVPLEYTHEERNALNPVRSAEDKRKMVRALIEKIPTKKEDLFDYNLDWSMVDAALMEKRIQPWIRKKIVEYIGEEEPTLVEFICSKIMSKSPPERIYDDISMVLDDEAEVFVVKMWRLLIYETEAKKEGLNK